jgi:hypothetical protein
MGYDPVAAFLAEPGKLNAKMVVVPDLNFK